MSRRRRGVSFGTVVMLLFAAVVLLATFAVMYSIRQDEGDLAMDAEQLLSSINELLEISQRNLTDDEHQLAGTAAVFAASQAAQTPRPETRATAVPTQTVVQVQPQPQVQAQVIVTQQPVNALRTLSMTFGGSVTLESSIVDGAYDKGTDSYAYGDILAGISDAVHADLNIAVLENVFTTADAKKNDMVAPEGSLDALVAAGFDGVVLGAENALAGGESAVRETLSLLQGRGMMASGLYLPENSQHTTMLRINGIQIAILSYTDTLSTESKRGVPDAVKQDAMVDLFSEKQVLADVSDAKQRGAHVVIAFLHWGNKQATEPTQAQRKIAQTLCDNGVSVIIGTHSRAVQPVERLISSDGMQQTVVAWSLGTLLCEDRDTRDVVSGALLHVQLTYDAENGKINMADVEYTPTYAWRQEENGLQKYRVVLSAEDAPVTMIQKQQEIMGRSLTLIQTVMEKGVATQR